MAGNRPIWPVATGEWNIERIVRLVALAVLAIACIQVVFPFVGALTWAGIIAISVWPAFLWLSARLGQRPVLAAVASTLVLIALLVVPFTWIAVSLGHAVPEVAKLIGDLASRAMPTVPEWINAVPMIGPVIEEAWASVATDLPTAVKRLAPDAEKAGVWVLARGATATLAVLEFLFAILISGVFLVTADRASAVAERIVTRLDIGRGTLLATVVTTIRSVALGIVGTAAIQSMVAAAGLLVAGVPGVALLGFLTFLIALLQLPTLLVWGPAALWLYLDGQVAPGIGLAIYGGLIVNWVDNILRPLIISRGAKLPFALIFIGVIGGVLAWGLLGLFIGPTLLAVAYSLVVAWMGDAVESGPEPTLPEPPVPK